MHYLALSTLCTLLPLVLADTSYKVSDVQFWEYKNASGYIDREVMNLGAKGTTPGALVVDCILDWDPRTAAQVPATGPPLIEQFNCSDPAVNVTMQRMTISQFEPWYLTVQLNNANPATWNPFARGAIPYRGGANFTDKNGQSYDEYIFDNHEFTFSGAPALSLPEALREYLAPNGTGSHSDWSQDAGGSSGLRTK